MEWLSRLREAVRSSRQLVSSTALPVQLRSAQLLSDARRRLNTYIVAYERLIGLTELKEAQSRVLQAETRFLSAQSERRTLQVQLTQLQTRLRELHSEIGKTARSEDRYLTLITEEHGLLRRETVALDQCKQSERTELETFGAFSSAVRDAHVRERCQAERSRNWSLLLSALGAVAGAVATTLRHRRYAHAEATAGGATSAAGAGASAPDGLGVSSSGLGGSARLQTTVDGLVAAVNRSNCQLTEELGNIKTLVNKIEQQQQQQQQQQQLALRNRSVAAAGGGGAVADDVDSDSGGAVATKVACAAIVVWFITDWLLSRV